MTPLRMYKLHTSVKEIIADTGKRVWFYLDAVFIQLVLITVNLKNKV